MLIDAFVVFFAFIGPFEASFNEIPYGQRPYREEKEARLANR